MTLLIDIDRVCVDKDAGVLAELRPYLLRHQLAPDDDEILSRFDEEEGRARSGRPLPYRKVLRQVMRGFGFAYQFSHTDAEIRALESSVADWPIYPDALDGLRRLKTAHRLVAMTSLDADLFASVAERLGDPFDAVVSPKEAGAYPPSIRFIQKAKAVAADPNATLVAGSGYEYLPAAKTIGLPTILIDRTPLEGDVPPMFFDRTFADLFGLCDHLKV